MGVLRQAVTKVLGPFRLGRSPRLSSTHRQNLVQFAVRGSDREWRQNIMYCELMLLTADVPGDIAEFGVSSGSSLMCLSRINETLNLDRNHREAKKRVFGFDSFDGLPRLDEVDLVTLESRSVPDLVEGGFSGRSGMRELADFVAEREATELVEGWFHESVPAFLKARPHVMFSLIHIDCDLYASTLSALESTLPRLSIGGAILFDELFQQSFPGETIGFREAYEAMRDAGSPLELELSRVPSMPWKWYAKRIA